MVNNGKYLENGEPLFCGSWRPFRDFIRPMTKADWTGRLKKKFEETALLGQKWLKDEDKTVQEVLKDRGLDTVGPCWTIFDIIWCQQGCCNFAVWRNDMEAFHWDWLTHWPSTIKFNNKKTYEKNKGLVSDVLGDADDCKQPSRTQEKIAKLGENIVIRRFTRLTLGEARYACRLQSCDRLRNTKKSKNATRFPILETTFHCVERLSQVRVRSGWN